MDELSYPTNIQAFFNFFSVTKWLPSNLSLAGVIWKKQTNKQTKTKQKIPCFNESRVIVGEYEHIYIAEEKSGLFILFSHNPHVNLCL